MLGAIWAQSLDRVIGDGKDMNWHIPEDLRHFKDITMGDPVIMGSRSWLALPEKFRPLPGRTNYVLSSRAPGDWSRGAEVITSIDGLSGWITGGGEVYAATLNQVDRIEVTLIDALLTDSVDSVVYAPEIGPDFELAEESEWMTSDKGTVDGSEEPARFRFQTYLRKAAS